MLEKFLQFYSEVDKIIFYTCAFALLASLILGLTLPIVYSHLPSKIPLFYSLPWGEQELSRPIYFLILPSLIVAIALANLLLSWHLHSSQLVLKRILNISSSAIALFILITAFKILFIFL